jgi:glycosyltransferase involved in cell wall biosynthesis
VTITLIVTTYNWEKALELLLMSVLSQTRMPDQFIVADDGSREDTRELIDEFVSRFDIPVLHVWHKDDGFQRSVILNQAIGKATGDYIIQVDGDVILHRCFVEDHEFFAAPGYFIRGHRIRLSKEYSKQVFDQKSIVFNDTFKGLLQVFKTARMRWVSTVFRLDLRRHAEVYGCNHKSRHIGKYN